MKSSINYLGAPLAGVLLTASLGACDAQAPTTPSTPVAATSSASVVPSADATTPTAAIDPSPVAQPTTAPSPTVDAYSQEIGGVVYQGTEDAPVRIGDDTPGQPPAVEARLTRANSADLTASSGKYLIYVMPVTGGWAWKVFTTNQNGNFRELSNSGLSANPIPTRDAALAGPFVVDGRALDRAEYMVFSEPS